MVRQSFLGEQDSGGTLGVGRVWIDKGKKGGRAGGRRGRRWGGRLIGGLGMRGWIVAPKSGCAPQVLSREWRERGSLRVAEKEQVPAQMMDWAKGWGRVKGSRLRDKYDGATNKNEGGGGTSLVAQWLRLCALNAGGPGSIPRPGTRSRTHAATKSSHATTKEPVSHN